MPDQGWAFGLPSAFVAPDGESLPFIRSENNEQIASADAP